MERLYATYGDRAAIFVVYIAEAHAVDGWQVAPNVQEGVCIAEHRSMEQRRAAARRCTADLGITIPTLVDEMDDGACMAYAAWPDRVYVVDTAGRVAYKGVPGPWGFRVAEAAAALKRLLEADHAGTANPGAARDALRAPETLTAFRGPGFFNRGGRATPEMVDVAEAWQLPDGRVYLRSATGEERVVQGYIGGVGLHEGQLVLVDSPDDGGLPALRRQALGLHRGSEGDACPVE